MNEKQGLLLGYTLGLAAVVGVTFVALLPLFLVAAFFLSFLALGCVAAVGKVGGF